VSSNHSAQSDDIQQVEPAAAAGRLHDALAYLVLEARRAGFPQTAQVTATLMPLVQHELAQKLQQQR